MSTPLDSKTYKAMDPIFHAFVTDRIESTVQTLTSASRQQLSLYRAQPKEDVVAEISSLLKVYLEACVDPATLDLCDLHTKSESTLWPSLSLTEMALYISLYRSELIDQALQASQQGIAGAIEAIRTIQQVADDLLGLFIHEHDARAAMFEALADYSIDGVVVYSQEEGIQYANNAFVAGLEIASLDDVLGKQLDEVLPAHKTEKDYHDTLSQLEKTGRWQGFLEGQLPNGELWRAALSAFTLHGTGPDDKAKTCLIIRNVSEELLVVEKHKQQGEQLSMFEELIANTNDGIVVTDMENRIIYVNNALVRMNGMPSAEAYRSYNIAELMTEDQVKVLMEEAFPSVAQHGMWKGYFWAQRPDKSLWRAFNSIFRIYDENKQPKYTCSIVRDITPEYEAEKEMRDLQERVIEAQRAALRELSTPLIPLADGVVVMPLIGSIDSIRVQEILASLLEGVSAHRARTAIVDITGVKVVDTQVANAMVHATQATRLLGAQVILTGISPEVAQTLVGMGAGLEGIITRATLQSGIQYALKSA
jgi:rsbT co-antagonist protein RsbR